MKKTVQALVVDDYKAVCEGLAALVEKTGLFDKVFVAFTGEQALEILKTKWIHLAMVDARMPGLSGIDLIKLKHKMYPSLKVVAMTSFDEEATLKEIWLAKVNGILLKRSTDANEIKECLQQVSEGERYFSHEIRDMIRGFNPIDEATPSLTTREKEILRLVCVGNSTKEIAAHYKLSVSTVEDYRKEMLRKTKSKNTPELVAYAHRNGLV
ncbi:DNA-binding response regulator [Cytophagales bacterium WSM2-2]|nr:DNA-binding response regulator [Cytophagales bacterium WSM2-2]